MEALQKLFTHELEDLYDAEQQILKALPKMIEGATSPELQKALQQHRAVTEKQATRLEQIFDAMGEERSRRKCKGMAGLLAEGEDILKEDFEPSTMDAAIIGAAQRVEHYEIAAYGTLRTLAEFLKNEQAASLLEQTLEEEKEADELLTQIAEASINSEAASEEDEEEEEDETKTPRTARTTAGAKSKARSTKQRSTRPRAKAGR
jgi:ferritin-like metal-binding protein YciE